MQQLAVSDLQSSDELRIAQFGQALDDLRREIEAQLGAEDARYIERIGNISRSLEVVGRGLLYLSIEPVGFSLGVTALWAHKALELMEIGHNALHGAFDGLPVAERYHADRFVWKAPVDEAAWRASHNVRHHQYTNIQGKDPDLNFGQLRLSANVPYKLAHALQPLSNLLTGFGFGMALNLQVTGMLDLYFKPWSEPPEVLDDREPATRKKARRAFFSKFVRYYGKEYVFYPMLAGPFAAKVLLGNVISEVARDLYAAAIIYCGHIGSTDYPKGFAPKDRAAWYAMQVEGSRNVEVPHLVSILAGGLDRQIEHHLFPRLPPNRLRQIAPKVRELSAKHGVKYRTDTWGATLKSVLGELRRLGSPTAKAA